MSKEQRKPLTKSQVEAELEQMSREFLSSIGNPAKQEELLKKAKGMYEEALKRNTPKQTATKRK